MSGHVQQAAQLPQQMQTAKVELQAARQQEEALLRQSLVAMFADLQQKIEVAQRRTILRTWQVFAALGAVLMLYVGMLLPLKHKYRRLQDAQARADSAEVSAEVQHASQHAVIPSAVAVPASRSTRTCRPGRAGGKECMLAYGKPGK